MLYEFMGIVIVSQDPTFKHQNTQQVKGWHWSFWWFSDLHLHSLHVSRFPPLEGTAHTCTYNSAQPAIAVPSLLLPHLSFHWKMKWSSLFAFMFYSQLVLNYQHLLLHIRSTWLLVLIQQGEHCIYAPFLPLYSSFSLSLFSLGVLVVHSRW